MCRNPLYAVKINVFTSRFQRNTFVAKRELSTLRGANQKNTTFVHIFDCKIACESIEKTVRLRSISRQITKKIKSA